MLPNHKNSIYIWRHNTRDLSTSEFESFSYKITINKVEHGGTDLAPIVGPLSCFKESVMFKKLFFKSHSAKRGKLSIEFDFHVCQEQPS